MKQQILSEQFRKMQKLAGLLNENKSEEYFNNQQEYPLDTIMRVADQDPNEINRAIETLVNDGWISKEEIIDALKNSGREDLISYLNENESYNEEDVEQQMEKVHDLLQNKEFQAFSGLQDDDIEEYMEKYSDEDTNRFYDQFIVASEETRQSTGNAGFSLNERRMNLPKKMKKGALKEAIKKEIKRILKEDLDTLNMGNKEKVEEIIKLLKGVDGETMEYIIRQVGMEDQMLHQLGGVDMDLDEAYELSDEDGNITSSLPDEVNLDEKKGDPTPKKKTEKSKTGDFNLDIQDEEPEVEDIPVDNEGGDVKAVQAALQDAYDKAKGLGDDKLLHQIGNTITMFTKTHVINQEAPVNENRRRRK